MIPGKIFTGFAEFQGIVSVNDFRFPLGFQELLQASRGFLRSFCFCTDTPGSIEWLDPAPRLHIGDCFESLILHWELCDLLCHQVTKIFRSRHDCTSAFSAKSPCYFGSQADITIWVLEKVMKRLSSCFTKRTRGCVPMFWNAFIHKILRKFFQPFWQITQRVSPYSLNATRTLTSC